MAKYSITGRNDNGNVHVTLSDNVPAALRAAGDEYDRLKAKGKDPSGAVRKFVAALRRAGAHDVADMFRPEYQ
ncbi:hypothetical protein [Actinokineospora diospyrosa]|uniref:Lsr2 protein n=1 Tax=Actinokineospora diospyrosa TaxID=103728 RepID=A0ABT1I6C7_9PSEU|nr:hypothetical protein [Actinokineospora diospyrosa]MCP2268175.1 hypothetical protein [Actinokineospora diospyrosa]